jgi:hypothetical protein
MTPIEIANSATLFSARPQTTRPVFALCSWRSWIFLAPSHREGKQCFLPVGFERWPVSYEATCFAQPRIQGYGQEANRRRCRRAGFEKKPSGREMSCPVAAKETEES